jgi:hydroxyacylglutathione hydrolase
MKIWHTKSGYSVSCVLSGRSNVFLLTGSGKNILIDGSPGNKWTRLESSLKKLNINKLDYMILTHTHYDHAENAARIQNRFGAAVIVNQREGRYLQKGENIIPHGTIFLTRLLVEKFGRIFLTRMNYEPCQPDILVDQYFDMREMGINAYIIHTPGHSPGSQSIIVDDEIALTGDAMFGIFPRSVFPPFADREDELIKSWGKLIETGCNIFLPSHGTSSSRSLLEKEFNKRSHSTN